MVKTINSNLCAFMHNLPYFYANYGTPAVSDPYAVSIKWRHGAMAMWPTTPLIQHISFCYSLLFLINRYFHRIHIIIIGILRSMSLRSGLTQSWIVSWRVYLVNAGVLDVASSPNVSLPRVYARRIHCAAVHLNKILTLSAIVLQFASLSSKKG